jgi:hypothetical protein
VSFPSHLSIPTVYEPKLLLLAARNGIGASGQQRLYHHLGSFFLSLRVQ